MLDKLKFNNLVISNKKGIQQSRIQTINKLVHKIRKLKILLEKRTDDDKCKERLRKSSETVELLKKFKRVEMMKHVLLLEKPPAAIITNGLSTPEEIAIALLAMNKIMQLLIKRFKTELHLTDDGEDKWRIELLENSKRRQKIEKTEMKRLQRKTLKEQKAMDHKRKKWLEQNCENVDNPEEANISTVGGWKVEDLKVANNVQKKLPTKLEAKPDKLQSAEETETKSKEDVARDNNSEDVKKVIRNKRNHEDKINKSKPKKSKKDEEVSQKSIKFTDNASSEEDTSFQQNETPCDDDNETETHIVDPFFVTDTGENYLSTAVINRDNLHQENNDNQKDLHMVKLNGSKKHTSYRERKVDNSDRRTQQGSWKNNNDRGAWKQNNDTRHYAANSNNRSDWKKDQEKWANKTKHQSRGQTQDRFARDQKTNTNPPMANAKTDEKIHPSWAAKQRQKPIITGFQGKKILFDDEGTSNDNDHKTASTINVKFNKKEVAQSKNSNADSLHPSWAAKQKLKPTITAFQGKKITFDNDD